MMWCGVFWFSDQSPPRQWHQFSTPPGCELTGDVIYKDMEWDPTVNPVVLPRLFNPALTVKYTPAPGTGQNVVTQRYGQFEFSSMRVTR